MFYPPLRCASADADRYFDPQGISKLMTDRDASDELRELKATWPRLRKVPNAGRYFLGLGTHDHVYKCKPRPLTPADKQGFGRCHGLMSMGIKATNVNAKLDKVRIINSPHGGLELSDAWAAAFHSNDAAASWYTSGFRAINGALQRLLQFGIVPMNREGVLHCDLKAPNVLVSGGPAMPASSGSMTARIRHFLSSMSPRQARNKESVYAKIIDWGLATTVNNGRMPSTFAEGRYIMYNCPVSIMLLHDDLQRPIEHAARTLGWRGPRSTGAHTIARMVAKIVYGAYREIVGRHGHDDYLQSIMENVIAPTMAGPEFNDFRDEIIASRRPRGSSRSSSDTPSPHDVGAAGRGEAVEGVRSLCSYQSTVTEYLAAVLFKFLSKNDSGTFDRDAFFKKVFAKNLDVYGLAMCYAPLIEARPADLDAAWTRNTLSSGVTRMLAEYCFGPKYAAEPIPVVNLINALKALDDHDGLPPSPAPRNRHPPLAVRARPDEDEAGLRASLGALGASEGERAVAVQGARAAGSRGISWRRDKRCPKGRKRNKRDGRCYKTRKEAPVRQRTVSWPANKRCPAGMRRDRLDGKCHPK